MLQHIGSGFEFPRFAPAHTLPAFLWRDSQPPSPWPFRSFCPNPPQHTDQPSSDGAHLGAGARSAGHTGSGALVTRAVMMDMYGELPDGRLAALEYLYRHDACLFDYRIPGLEPADEGGA